MEQRVSIVTLGVADVAASKRFYERLGWAAGMDVQETVFFQIGDLLLILWGRDKLAADSGVSDTGGWGGVTLAHNVHSNDEVDRLWSALTADGGEAGRCGWLKDRFGLSWQIIPERLGELLGDPDRERAGRAMQAMLQMGRIEVAGLDAAADG